MKWKAPSERTQGLLVLPIAVPVAILAAPIVLLYVAGLKLSDWLTPSQEWHSWFAWRPVPLGHWSDHVGKRGEWAWLQRLERRSMPYDWPTEYRLPLENPHAQ